jgi:hypothetical protein
LSQLNKFKFNRKSKYCIAFIILQQFLKNLSMQGITDLNLNLNEFKFHLIKTGLFYSPNMMIRCKNFNMLLIKFK